jgi:hypothetical protein
LEFAVPKLCHFKTNVEVEPWEERRVLTRRDPDPVVFTRLFSLGNDTVPLDHLTLYPFLVQKSFQNGNMVHNVSRYVVQLDTQSKTAEVYVHYVLYIFVSLC